MSHAEISYPQVKVCGLTVVEEARACAASGADAIGLVFHPPSPRHVTLEQARLIAAALPDHVPAVGVFSNPEWDHVTAAISFCGLRAVQLHGNETPAFVDRLRRRYKIIVLKGLFAVKAPLMSQAGQFHASAYLVECGRGVLPGGNALSWDWGSALAFALTHPTVLAGGLNPGNVAAAISACLPDAVDASSGLESAPGRKDPHKVARFISEVRRTSAVYRNGAKTLQGIFRTT